jgi:hypothetical protein
VVHKRRRTYSISFESDFTPPGRAVIIKENWVEIQPSVRRISVHSFENDELSRILVELNFPVLFQIDRSPVRTWREKRQHCHKMLLCAHTCTFHTHILHTCMHKNSFSYVYTYTCMNTNHKTNTVCLFVCISILYVNVYMNIYMRIHRCIQLAVKCVCMRI